MQRKFDGTFFEFRHHNTAEGKYWNPALKEFEGTDWRNKIREIHALGMEYVMIMATALYERCFYQSKIFPFADMKTEDPIEEVLDEADKLGLKVFLGNGFFGNWRRAHHNIKTEEIVNMSFKAMEEITALYGHHPSFYGWYYPDECFIKLHFPKAFVSYVNRASKLAHELTPGKKTLIAPYGTNVTWTNDRYVKDLVSMDLDYIVYQDEVGVQKTPVYRTEKLYEKLKRVHDEAGRAELWAEVEIFKFEGVVYDSALLPASFERVKRQIENVAPFANKIVAYQYLGIMNPEDSPSHAGHPDSVKLYTDYVNYLKEYNLL